MVATDPKHIEELCARQVETGLTGCRWQGPGIFTLKNAIHGGCYKVPECHPAYACNISIELVQFCAATPLSLPLPSPISTALPPANLSSQ